MQKLVQIFRQVFEDDTIQLNADTSAQQIPKWDSFHHINLMLEIEEAFGVEFSTDEIVRSTKVSELVSIIKAKKPGVSLN